VADTTVATGFTAILFDNEFFDTDGFHSTSSNTSRMTVPTGKAGKYLITGGFRFESFSGDRLAQLRLNGTTPLCRQDYNSSSTGGTVNLNLSRIVNLAVGDYIELVAYQNSGATQSLLGTTSLGNYEGPFLDMVLLGA
jgi:hypothetical protein